MLTALYWPGRFHSDLTCIHPPAVLCPMFLSVIQWELCKAKYSITHSRTPLFLCILECAVARHLENVQISLCLDYNHCGILMSICMTVKTIYILYKSTNYMISHCSAYQCISNVSRQQFQGISTQFGSSNLSSNS